MPSARLSNVAASLAAVSLLFHATALAAFPDVPPTHTYAPYVDKLSSFGILKGHPTGLYDPEGNVNRAEMLTILYRAVPRTAEPPASPCKSDVPRGIWYEATVCDAIARGYVKGYDDGLFRPERTVSRGEAVKMALTVTGKAVGDVSPDEITQMPYKDVWMQAWYAPYVASALRWKLLPFPGEMHAQTFQPEKPLTRGEAAALAGIAMFRRDVFEEEVGASSSLSSSLPSTVPVSSDTAVRSRAAASSAASLVGARLIDVDFPFNDDGTFEGKRSIAYRFPLQSSVVGLIEVSLTGAQGSVSCTLFRLGKDGISTEYYLGHERDGMCRMRVALAPGTYQLDVRPKVAGASFTLTSRVVTGDGNDGFAQAKLLTSAPLTGFIETDDTADWYTFSVGEKKTMTVELTNAVNVGCIVYPLDNVDLFGFENPECNVSFDYPKGTYVVGVTHGGATAQQGYSVRLK